MKKVLIIIIILIIGFGSYCQTAEEYNLRGLSKADLKDYKGALEDYSKAIELDPNDSHVYKKRGLSKLNQKESACLDFNKAKELGNEEAIEMIKKNCNKK